MHGERDGQGLARRNERDEIAHAVVVERGQGDVVGRDLAGITDGRVDPRAEIDRGVLHLDAQEPELGREARVIQLGRRTGREIGDVKKEGVAGRDVDAEGEGKLEAGSQRNRRRGRYAQAELVCVRPEIKGGIEVRVAFKSSENSIN